MSGTVREVVTACRNALLAAMDGKCGADLQAGETGGSVSMDSGENQKILVAGVGKSGTTALYFRIKNSMPTATAGFFEPPVITDDLAEALKGKLAPVIVKLLVGSDLLKASFIRHFDRKIAIVRDPRDILVSVLLYTSATQILWKLSDEEINAVQALLEEKEKYPGSVSVLELFGKLMKFDHDELGAGIDDNFKVLLQLLNDYDFFVFRYEDLIENNFVDLEKYLNFRMSANDEVHSSLSRVVRTKNTGSWRNWFLDSDIDFFRPLLSDYMNKLGYIDCWEINDHQVIMPDHCSKYFMRVINEMRKN